MGDFTKRILSEAKARVLSSSKQETAEVSLSDAASIAWLYCLMSCLVGSDVKIDRKNRSAKLSTQQMQKLEKSLKNIARAGTYDGNLEGWLFNTGQVALLKVAPDSVSLEVNELDLFE